MTVSICQCTKTGFIQRRLPDYLINLVSQELVKSSIFNEQLITPAVIYFCISIDSVLQPISTQLSILGAAIALHLSSHSGTEMS